MSAMISYNHENLPKLSKESLRHLDDIKERALARKAARLAKGGTADKMTSLAPSGARKVVTIESKRKPS